MLTPSSRDSGTGSERTCGFFAPSAPSDFEAAGCESSFVASVGSALASSCLGVSAITTLLR
jgi:hypothetical protein